MSNPYNEYLMRPMENNTIRVYYPFIGKKGRRAYKTLGDFTVEAKGLESIAEEIIRKSEELVEKYLAEMN
ncbi:hypothetical protein KY333_02775 [Candidatus Woesearchaeota archaeon]|nr:hypothetical protein [Candidatus Woesearchaeota archaeon]